MHKQRRASRSAPAKVTRVMSRCPLCRTNSATRPKAHSRVRSDGGGGGGGGASAGREEAEEETDPFLALPPPWNPLSRDEGKLSLSLSLSVWLKPGASKSLLCCSLISKITRFKKCDFRIITMNALDKNYYIKSKRQGLKRLLYRMEITSNAPRFSLRIDSGIVGAYFTVNMMTTSNTFYREFTGSFCGISLRSSVIYRRRWRWRRRAEAAAAAAAAAAVAEEEDEEEEEEEEEGPCQPACRPNRARSIGNGPALCFGWIAADAIPSSILLRCVSRYGPGPGAIEA
ncbi:hypothetical protein ALC57_02490 [Trachymyrmex cornetzi]|uniref:Uncharacterized protein n=1 Tax=Trachymyrmex cornetzi TaxID=471704 RepID=A0A195EJJ4_9HYME|nr:hypothetical protein ALC57_02490 [Trachymyrmex cornetzi]